MKPFRSFLVLTLSCLAVSCSFQSRDRWNEGVIAVMADSTDWVALESVLNTTYERVVRTPQIEKTYTLRYVKPAEIDNWTNYRYLILAATLESTGRVGKIVQRVVSDPEVYQWVQDGRNYVFTQKNQWAKNQLMTILVSKDLATLREKIEANSEFLYAIFDTDVLYQIKKDMYLRREQIDLEQQLLTTANWTVRLQHDYFIDEEDLNEGFVSFRRMVPERWFFVHWIDGGDTTQLDPYWVLAQRNRIGGKYYSGSRVSDQYFFSTRSSFLGRPAQVTTGLWESDTDAAGGPFKNYTFYDELTKRTYMIDYAVFAPGKDKMSYLRRLDVMARTFRTIFDPSEEAKVE